MYGEPIEATTENELHALMHPEEPVIEVKHLAKQYRIGMDRTYKTSAIKVPMRASLYTYMVKKKLSFEWDIYR